MGTTPLHDAAENGNIQICQLIMKNAKDKNPKDNNGKTPFHLAAENGHMELCRIFDIKGG